MSQIYKLRYFDSHEFSAAVEQNDEISPVDLSDKIEHLTSLPFQLKLIKVTETEEGFSESNDLSSLKNVWEDLLPDKFCMYLMSSKLKEIIESHLTGEENIKWINCFVNYGDERREYFVLRSNMPHDVLDKEKTKFIQKADSPMWPWLSKEKIQNLAVFTLPSKVSMWSFVHCIYVNNHLKRSIEKGGITGVGFDEVKEIT